MGGVHLATDASLKRMLQGLLFRRRRSCLSYRPVSGVWIVAVLAGLLAGCANVGQPRPPSLHLPAVAEHVSAVRVGDAVRLTWLTPAQTTEGDKLRGSTTAVICRDEGKASPVMLPAPCHAVQRLAVQPGDNTVEDALPVQFATGLPGLLVYRVELFNSQQRSAGRSLPVFVPSGTAPAAVQGLSGTPVRDGVVLTWQRTGYDSEVQVELNRSLVRAPTASAQEKQARQQPLLGGKSGNDPGGESILKAAANADSGGMVDHGLMDGDSATYFAQRVRTVALGGQAYEIRSVPSSTVKVTYRKTFPPRAPVGLVTIPAGSMNAPGGLSIDLSWEPNPEDDVAGYNLYRAEQPGEGGKPVFGRLNTALLPGPFFRDLHLAASHSYLYRATAVDEHGNESMPGAAVGERVTP